MSPTGREEREALRLLKTNSSKITGREEREALRLLKTNSSKITFERNSRKFQNRLLERGYPAAILRKYLSEVKFADRKTALQQKQIRT